MLGVMSKEDSVVGVDDDVVSGGWCEQCDGRLI